MNATDLPRLCRGASEALGLPDADALGRGERVVVAGVGCELHHAEGMAGAVLVAEIGTPAAAQAASVHRQLLRVQLLSADQPGLRFGLHPGGDVVVLMQTLTPGPLNDAEAGARALAAIVRATAAQARDWRDTLLVPVDPFDDPAGDRPGPHALQV